MKRGGFQGGHRRLCARYLRRISIVSCRLVWMSMNRNCLGWISGSKRLLWMDLQMELKRRSYSNKSAAGSCN